MKNKYICLILFFFFSISCANAFDFFGDSWKEDVVLQDGRHLVVSRHQSYGGDAHEIGQPSPVQSQRIEFKDPVSDETIKWDDITPKGMVHADLDVVAIHYAEGVPYIVAVPHLCDAFSYWHEPNPPYVIYKLVKSNWKVVDIEDFPYKLTNINVLLGRVPLETGSNNIVSAGEITLMNRGVNGGYLKKIIRTKVNFGCD